MFSVLFYSCTLFIYLSFYLFSYIYLSIYLYIYSSIFLLFPYHSLTPSPLHLTPSLPSFLPSFLSLTFPHTSSHHAASLCSAAPVLAASVLHYHTLSFSSYRLQTLACHSLNSSWGGYNPPAEWHFNGV